MNEPGLEKAMDTLQYLSQDSEARRLYEARQKYLHDEASMLGSAELAGIKKVAKNMLDMDIDIANDCKSHGINGARDQCFAKIEITGVSSGRMLPFLIPAAPCPSLPHSSISLYDRRS